MKGLPQAMPGILATGIFAFLFAWNEYLFALILPMAVVFGVVQRYLVTGIGAGGVKG